ncbi:MAG: 50S ribosomal protein L9 [Lachnospiraceae bacterium]|nr:50S ribosomal protein L9 [Lachnospiraceae bacterium]
MKVILIQDVKSLGKKGEVVNVSDGYARNFILPKGLGLEADAKNLNDLKLQKANEAKKAQQLLEAAQELAKVLETKEVVLKMKSGKDGKAFGAVSSKEIASAAKQQCDLELDKKKIQLPESIKALGVYEVSVKLHPQVTGKLKVKVIEENAAD